MELGCVTLVHKNFTNQKPLLSFGVHGFYWGFIKITWLIDSLTTHLNSTFHPLYLPEVGLALSSKSLATQVVILVASSYPEAI